MEPTLGKFTIEVMGHMSPTKWMTGKEIIEEISGTWKKMGRRKKVAAFFSLFAPSFAEEIVLRPNYGSMSVAFAELEERRLAESRLRSEAPEITAQRNNHRLREYKLTERGHRIKAGLGQTSRQEERGFVHKPA
jgi:hypothetical protein